MRPKPAQTVLAVNSVQARYTPSLAAALRDLAYMPDLHTRLHALLRLWPAAHSTESLLGVSDLSHCFVDHVNSVQVRERAGS